MIHGLTHGSIHGMQGGMVRGMVVIMAGTGPIIMPIGIIPITVVATSPI